MRKESVKLYKSIALLILFLASAIVYLKHNDQRPIEASTDPYRSPKHVSKKIGKTQSDDESTKKEVAEKIDYHKLAKDIVSQMEKIFDESPRVDTTENQEAPIRVIYPDQHERVSKLLIDHYKNNFKAFVASSDLAIKAMFHFGGDSKYGIIFLYLVKKYHQKEYREKCVEMTLMVNRSRPNLKRLKKIAYQCVAWQPNPLKRTCVVEYLLTLREIKGKVAALKELEEFKKYFPEFRYKNMISYITDFNEEEAREGAREE